MEVERDEHNRPVDTWDAAAHDAKYVAALLAGKEPPMSLIHETKSGAHIYQREDGRFYHWPEETLF